jgi:hypothetical protein
MRKLVLVLPVAALLLAAGVLFSNMGSLFAATPTPTPPGTDAGNPPPTIAAANTPVDGGWHETASPHTDPPAKSIAKPQPKPKKPPPQPHH